jgi:hypothetical protein
MEAIMLKIYNDRCEMSRGTAPEAVISSIAATQSSVIVVCRALQTNPYDFPTSSYQRTCRRDKSRLGNRTFKFGSR